jgi:hypothetical protein
VKCLHGILDVHGLHFLGSWLVLAATSLVKASTVLQVMGQKYPKRVSIREIGSNICESIIVVYSEDVVHPRKKGLAKRDARESELSFCGHTDPNGKFSCP